MPRLPEAFRRLRALSGATLEADTRELVENGLKWEGGPARAGVRGSVCPLLPARFPFPGGHGCPTYDPRFGLANIRPLAATFANSVAVIHSGGRTCGTAERSGVVPRSLWRGGEGESTRSDARVACILVRLAQRASIAC